MLFAGILTPLLKGLQLITGSELATGTWAWFVAESQELFVLFTITALIVVSVMIFSMEYQYSTASYIFTSSISRLRIYIAKMTALLLMICLMFSTAFVAQILFGSLLLPERISKSLLNHLFLSTLWFIFSYFLLSFFMVIIPILTRQFTVSAGVLLSILVLTFPIHYWMYIPYANPFLTPTVVTAKMLNTDGYLFGSYYSGISINLAGIILYLVLLSSVSLTIGIIRFKKMDAIS